MKQPQPTKVDKTEVQRLIDLAEQGGLDAIEQRRLVPLLKTLLWLEHTLVSTRISVAKLNRLLFGHRTEQRKPKKDSGGGQGGTTGGSDAGTTGDSDAGSGVNDVSTGTDSSTGRAPPEEPPNEGKAAKGHGRRASTDYPGAETVVCSHPRLRPGDRYPACARGRGSS